jgi:ankyrin repeat protein
MQGRACSASDISHERTLSQKRLALNAALLKAVVKSNLVDVRRLIAQGADVNAKDSYGNCALVLALSRDFGWKPRNPANVPVVLTLLQHKVNIHVWYHGYNKRVSPLMLALYCTGASRQDYRRLITLLLHKGADVNARDNKGYSVLIYAAETAPSTARSDIFHLLLNKGADPHASDKEGRTALMSVAGLGTEHEAIVLSMLKTLFRKHVDINRKTSYGSTALTDAATAGNAPVVQQLLEHGAQVDAIDDYGWTPLIWAIERVGTLDTVRLLLRHGADATHRDKAGRTPLMWASERGKPAIVELLLTKQGDVDPRGPLGETPLMIAAGARDIEIARVLLKHGAKINNQDLEGLTPLMWAVLSCGIPQPFHTEGDKGPPDLKRDLPIVQFLLKSGADRQLKNKAGKTALELAEEIGYSEMVPYLK